MVNLSVKGPSVQIQFYYSLDRLYEEQLYFFVRNKETYISLTFLLKYEFCNIQKNKHTTGANMLGFNNQSLYLTRSGKVCPNNKLNQ